MGLGRHLVALSALAALASCGVLEESEDHCGYRQEGQWLLIYRYFGTPHRGWSVALIVCRGCPDVSKMEYVEEVAPEGGWYGAAVGKRPMMKVKRGQKVVWNWGDAVPLETHPLSREEQELITSGRLERGEIPDVVKKFLSNTNVPASTPTSRPLGHSGDIILFVCLTGGKHQVECGHGTDCTGGGA